MRFCGRGYIILFSSQLLVECGVVPAFDMTAEAAWAKLSYVLSKTELSYQQKVEVSAYMTKLFYQ